MGGDKDISVRFLKRACEMCDQLKNFKAQESVLSFTNYRDKAYNFIEVFLMKDKFKQHMINRC